jgi:hypothetical protein
MTASELTAYLSQIDRIFDRVCAAVQGLDEAHLNWRPPVPDTNSIYVIATHILGNAEAWALGIACELPIERDRPAEFLAAGADASAIVAKAAELRARIDDAVAALPAEALDGERRPKASLSSLWGAGTPEPVTARQALLQVIQHASGHLGQIDVTLDWMRATESIR